MLLNDHDRHLSLGLYDAVDQLSKGLPLDVIMQVLTNSMADAVLELTEGDHQGIRNCSIAFHRHFVRCLNMKNPGETDFVEDN